MRPSSSLPSRQSLESDLARARQNGDFAAEGACLIALGDIAKENEEYDLAQGLYGQAWSAYEKAGDTKAQAHSLKKLGDAFAKQDEQNLVHLMYDNAVSLYQSVNDQQGQAQTLYAKGEFYAQLYQNEDAQPCYRKALSLFRTVGDLTGEADAAYSLASRLWGQEHEKEVLSLLYQALDLYNTLGDQTGQSRVFESVRHYVDSELASQYLESMIEIQQKLGNLQQQAIGLLSLSEMRIKQDNCQSALAHCEQALAISIFLKDHEGTRRALNEIQWITVGRNAPAPIAHLERCLTSYRQIHDLDDEIKTLLAIGNQAKRLQNPLQARDLFQKAWDLNNQFPDGDSLKSSILWEFAELAESEGELTTALGYYEQMIPLVEIEKHDEWFAQFIEDIGYLLLRMNDIDRALEYFQRSCDLWQQTTERHKKGTILRTIGDIERKRGNYEAAHQALQGALSILSHYQILESGVLWRLGVLEAEQNHNAMARNYFQQAWDAEDNIFKSLSAIAQKRTRSITRVEILWYWGRFEWSHGNQRLGYDYCHQALISLVEKPDERLIQYRIPLALWQKEFEDMNCSTPHDSETSHDL